MKTISVAALFIFISISLWHTSRPVSGETTSAETKITKINTSTCGCLQINDLQNRQKAVNAALAALEQQQIVERWNATFTEATYQNDLIPIVMRAMGGVNAGAMSRMAGSIDPASCAIRTDNPPVTGCFAELIARNLQNRIDNCRAWKSDVNMSGNDYRSSQSMSDVIGELLTSYYEEQALIEEKLTELRAQCGNRGNNNSLPPGIPPTLPPNVPPGVPLPPSHRPPGTGRSGPQPGASVTPRPSPAGTPGGVPIGGPPGGPTGGPPVVPPPIPPPVVPPVLPPTGGGGPIGLRRTSGHVRYIFDGTMNFPGLGVFKLTSDSRIPFSITQNRITGVGTTILNFDTSGSQCKLVRPFDGRADMTVSGRLTGRTMNVTFSSRGGSQTTSESVKMECLVGGDQGFGYVLPIQQQAFSGQQRLTLPRQGQPYTEIQMPIGVGVSAPIGSNIGGPIGLTGTITLRVYVP